MVESRLQIRCATIHEASLHERRLLVAKLPHLRFDPPTRGVGEPVTIGRHKVTIALEAIPDRIGSEAIVNIGSHVSVITTPPTASFTSALAMATTSLCPAAA